MGETIYLERVAGREAADTGRKMLLLYSRHTKNVQSLNLVVQTRAANCYGRDFGNAGDLL